MWHQIVNKQNSSKRNFTKHNVFLEIHIYRIWNWAKQDHFLVKLIFLQNLIQRFKWRLMERLVRDVGAGVIVYLTFAVIGLGGWGETKHEMTRLHSAPLIHAYIRSHLSGFPVIQQLAASEERWHPCYHHHHHRHHLHHYYYYYYYSNKW